MTYRILITGSREAPDHDVARIRAAVTAEINYGLSTGQEVTVVHGACRGVDTLVDGFATGMRITVESYPANWSAGRSAGPARNQRMVDLGADVCLSFPGPSSRGTWDLTRRAEAADIPVLIHRLSEGS